MRPELEQTLEVTRRTDALVGGPFALALAGLHAEQGDLIFLTVRDRRYDAVHRSTRELGVGDPLGELLWGVGFDPRDANIRAAAWLRVSRALGGSDAGTTEIRRRLEKRRDDRLLELLDLVEASPHARPTGDVWATGWQYTHPCLDGPPYLVLASSEASVRIAVGVTDASGQPPRDLHVTDGGLCWLHQMSGLNVAEVERLLVNPPKALVPAAARLSDGQGTDALRLSSEHHQIRAPW
jgi:hypothetical protein